jgi:hypothetical protein
MITRHSVRVLHRYRSNRGPRRIFGRKAAKVSRWLQSAQTQQMGIFRAARCPKVRLARSCADAKPSHICDPVTRYGAAVSAPG